MKGNLDELIDDKYRLESVIPDLGSLKKTARLVSIFNRFQPPPQKKVCFFIRPIFFASI